jgi:isopentenyl phosphate kinase
MKEVPEEPYCWGQPHCCSVKGYGRCRWLVWKEGGKENDLQSAKDKAIEVKNQDEIISKIATENHDFGDGVGFKPDTDSIYSLEGEHSVEIQGVCNLSGARECHDSTEFCECGTLRQLALITPVLKQEQKCITCGKGKNETELCSNSFHFPEPSDEQTTIEKLREENEKLREAFKNGVDVYSEDVRELREQNEWLQQELERLKKFKDYVHDRLDKMGVPVDPESPHKAAGCRIGGRLDYVERLKNSKPVEKEDQEELAEEVVNVIWNLGEDSSLLHCKNYLKENYIITKRKV